MSGDGYAFGSPATTAIFSCVIALSVMVLIGLSFLSFKYSLRGLFGCYDPVLKTSTRYTYLMEQELSRAISQPYVTYNGHTFFMFEGHQFYGRRLKVKKLEVLTVDQLNTMFPLKTYKDWMNGGKEEVQNNNIGKVGYIENFEVIQDDEGANKNLNTTEIEDGNSVERYQRKSFQDSFHSAQLNISSNDDIQIMTNCNDEQDITDMLPKNKINYIVTENSINSNTPVTDIEEKHFTSGICAICLEDLQDDNNVRGLICGHVFHDECIDPWLTERKGCCPTCKKDLYIEINRENEEENQLTEEEQANIRENANIFNFKISDIIKLPTTGQPGDFELDTIFNINQSNTYSFFLILISTRIKAQTLLTTLQYIRNNEYSFDNDGNDTIEIPESEDEVDFTISNNPNLHAYYYIEQFMSKFNQPNYTDSLDCPPLPDLSKLNKQIQRVVEHHPKLFVPSDLLDLDHNAWKLTKKMRRGLKALRFKLLDVSEVQLYYFNVVKLYNERRKERLSLSRG